MSLAANALTTLDSLRIELKLISSLESENETLIDSGNHLTYTFANKDIIAGTITRITKTIGTVITDITSLISSFNYANGTITFSTIQTGIIKVEKYQFIQFDYSNDMILERKINAYSDWIEKAVGHKLGKANYIEKYAGNYRQRLIVNQYPILKINSITSDGDLIDSTTYSTDYYDAQRGFILKEDGWSGRSYLVGIVGEPIAPIRTIEVNYDAGYVLPKDDSLLTPRTLPYDIEELILGLISYDYSQYGSQGLKQFKVSDVEWVWGSTLRQNYQAILDRYMLRRV